MPDGIRVFRAKDCRVSQACASRQRTWSDLEDALEVAGDAHLLGELWRLREEGLSPEVVDLEHRGARLGR